ncbi:MAG: transposase [Sphingobacteriales bacterium]|nr:transposase [Sphingobacteriales bacterium]
MPSSFSNDLQLDAQTMMAYYTLRFQIEFDFRDAKQHFGLHKFKIIIKRNSIICSISLFWHLLLLRFGNNNGQ